MKNILLTTLLALVPAPSLFAGNILLSALDADYHGSFDPCTACFNPEGARDFIKVAVAWVRNGSTKPFLFVESSIIPPYADLVPGTTLIDGSKAFHVDGELALIKRGYQAGIDYERRDASTLAAALMNLSQYSAIVVASDFGGILTAAELSLLNAHRSQITSFLAQGGGVFAMAQSNDGIGLYDPQTGRGLDANFTDSSRGLLKCCQGLLGNEKLYGFLPYDVTVKSSNGRLDDSVKITPVGRRIGLTQFNLQGNVSHLYFEPTPGFQVASTDYFGRAVNLVAVYTPEPSTWLTIGVALTALVVTGKRRGASE